MERCRRTPVYTGFWNHYTKDAANRSTLTLSNRNAAVLIAALAIFLQLAGGRSWNIICFVTHQLRTTSYARDGLYHQQQATLRNQTSDIRAVRSLANIGWAWRSRFGFQNSISLILLGIIHTSVFGALSILSSHITTVGDQVLLGQSPTCGPWDGTIFSSSDHVTVIDAPRQNADSAYRAQSMQASQEFVSNCLGDSPSSTECNTFNQPRFDWTSSSVPCPFDGMCLGSNDTGALRMDSGLLDSRDDFGINGPDADRIQFRRHATCVPIKAEGYVSSGTTTIVVNSDTEQTKVNAAYEAIVNYTAAFYGPQGQNLSAAGIIDPALQNATYLYTNFRDLATELWNFEKSPYDIHTQFSSPGLGIAPIPQLVVPNSLLVLLFAAFYGSYTAPVDDLWLSSHQEYNQVISTSSDQSSEFAEYTPDHVFSTLACTEQFQFCNPSPRNDTTSQCTAWFPSKTTIDQQDPAIREVVNNDRQLETASVIMWSARHSTIYDLIVQLPIPLLAEKLSYGASSLPVAPNQWAIEASNWFNINLANTQRLLMGYITGPPQSFEQFAVPNQAANNSNLAYICRNQIVRRGDYTNFSTLAIFLIFALGGLLMVVSLCLEPFLGWVREKRQRGLWRQKIWNADSFLQMQHAAYRVTGKSMGRTGSWKAKIPVDEEQEWVPAQTWEDLPLIEERKKSSSVDAKSEEHEHAAENVSSVCSREKSPMKLARSRSSTL